MTGFMYVVFNVKKFRGLSTADWWFFRFFVRKRNVVTGYHSTKWPKIVTIYSSQYCRLVAIFLADGGLSPALLAGIIGGAVVSNDTKAHQECGITQRW